MSYGHCWVTVKCQMWLPVFETCDLWLLLVTFSSIWYKYMAASSWERTAFWWILWVTGTNGQHWSYATSVFAMWSGNVPSLKEFEGNELPFLAEGNIIWQTWNVYEGCCVWWQSFSYCGMKVPTYPTCLGFDAGQMVWGEHCLTFN